jgi:hypothetical protein
MTVRGLGRTIAGTGALELALALVAVTVAYASSLDGYFHGDDFVAFVDMVTKPIDKHLYDAVTFNDNNYYWRPLGQLYYRIIYETAGLQAWAFRACNLAVFLITLALLHRVCLNLGMSRVAAFAAVVIFGLYPNHVVSVAWITNAPRLIALMFFLASLIALHPALKHRSWQLEGIAWFFMLLACLTDEVTIAMAPLPVAYAFFVHREYRTPVKLVARGIAYGLLIMILLPLQFLFTPDDEPRLAQYGFGEHMIGQAWSLLSQLALPLADANPMDVPEAWISDTQLAAGAAVAVVLGLCLVFGSNRLRFLVLWVAASLVPFTLWDLENVSPRYVYLAAAPFAITVSILGAAVVERVRLRPVQLSFGGALAAALVVLAVFGFEQTQERDGHWERATNDYRVLAEGMASIEGEIPEGSRIVVRDGPWYPYWFWPVATVRTIAQNPTLWAVSVPPGWPMVESLPGDVVLYHVDGRIHLTRVR